MSTSHVGDPREHAIVDTAMLRDRGLNQKQIERLVRTGRLYRVEQGVFTTSPPEGDLLLRALCHRRPALVFTGRTALELHEGREITLPVQAVVLPGKSSPARQPSPLRRRKRHPLPARQGPQGDVGRGVGGRCRRHV
ncbi:type IV toxin-antitoxin system AbiEi family antitoxin domain-containing protein [Corynebacterium suedekumii]|nr:type IV toxin-antitoxin system AbiEi family antitoxin domain-containing protein [Corynebacterium suedekumii]